MSKFFSTALFVSFAAAELSTTAWMPGMQDSGITYVGSVVGVSEDRTTMVVDYTNLPSDTSDDMYSLGPQTITIEGATYLEFQTSVTQSDVAMTISAACSRSNSNDLEATCTMTTTGLDDTLSSLSSLCAGPQSDADYCNEPIDVPTEMTTVLPEGYFGTFLLIVTAGDDLLPAATPSASSATATGSVSETAAPSTSTAASGSKSASSASASKSGAAPSGSATVLSTAGAPMMTMAPAVAALGAAAALFL